MDVWLDLKWSVIRQKCESQNGCFKKTKHAKCSEKRTYLCVSGGKKCSFFGKFGMLCFLKTPVLRFALSPYYRRILPLLSILISMHLIFLFPRKPIITPQEFVLPWEKNICPWISYRHLLSASSEECVSYKIYNLVIKEFVPKVFKYLNSFCRWFKPIKVIR